MSKQNTYQRIAAVSDYKDADRTIVHYRFMIQDGEFTETVREVKPSTSSQIVPAKGCVIVLDGSSIGEASLFELSGLQLMTQLEISGKYQAFGYCDKQEVNSAREAFFAKAHDQALEDHAKLLSKLEAVDKALSLY